MKELFLVGVGFAAGALAVAMLRENESSCCQRVAAGVRDRVTDTFGEWAGDIYDNLHLGSVAPALLDLFGVDP